MLMITRKEHESFVIVTPENRVIEVTVNKITGSTSRQPKVSLGLKAEKEIGLFRKEVWLQKLKEKE